MLPQTNMFLSEHKTLTYCRIWSREQSNEFFISSGYAIKVMQKFNAKLFSTQDTNSNKYIKYEFVNAKHLERVACQVE